MWLCWLTFAGYSDTPAVFFDSPPMGSPQGTGLGCHSKGGQEDCEPLCRAEEEKVRDPWVLLGWHKASRVVWTSWWALGISLQCTEGLHRGCPCLLRYGAMGPSPCALCTAGWGLISSAVWVGVTVAGMASLSLLCGLGGGRGWGLGGIRIACPPSLPGISRGQRGAGSRQLPWGRKLGYFGGCGGGAVGWHCPCQVTPPGPAAPWCQDGALGPNLCHWRCSVPEVL